ncbi:MAG: cobalt-precorrin 5A hydrolase [Candidatus Binatia bacterium]|nr:cobalt-precorrin 5A hydrolase [Candidatus Binatia bacterium]
MKSAAITLTRQGVDLCRRIEGAFPGTVVYVPDKYDALAPRHWRRFDGKLAPLVAEIFGQYEAHIFVMATGIVVRMIAPYVADKRYDPAIVVIDVTGRFAVSLCSGHLGGANQLARELGAALGAIPVVTTGTDVNDTLAPDLLAKELGAEIENWDALKTVSAALVDGEQVGVYADSCVPLPDLGRFAAKNVWQVGSPAELTDCRAGIVISHWTNLRLPQSVPVVIIRPKTLVVGIGCDRGVTVEEIETGIDHVFTSHHLARASIRNLATYVLKKDEEGLLEFARRHRLPLEWYEAAAINRIEDLIPNPSDVVYKFTGVLGVAEPVALLSAHATRLLVEKVKCGRLTLAVAVTTAMGAHE